MIPLFSTLLPWAFALLLASGGGGAPVRSECVCTPLTLPEVTEQATLVFTGRVISGDVAGDTEVLLGSGAVGGVRYRFVLEEAFKEAAPDTVEVWGGSGLNRCRYDFIVGQRYVVFAFRAWSSEGERDVVPVERCAPTALLHDAEETVRYLRTRQE